MELPICRSDLFPTKIMGILGKKKAECQRAQARPPLSQPRSSRTCCRAAGREPPHPPLQGPEQLSCLPRLGASIWRNRLPDPAYAFTQQQYVQKPLIQHSSLLPK